MGNILISSQRLLGHFIPAREIGIALQDIGHKVTLLGNKQNKKLLEGTGLGFIPIGWDKIPNLYLEEFSNEILEQIKNHDFDLFICDSTQPSPAYIAEIKKIPWISFQTTIPLPVELMPGSALVNRRLQLDYQKNLNKLRQYLNLPALPSETIRSRGDLAGISPYRHLVFVYPELLNEEIKLPPNTILVGNLNHQLERKNSGRLYSQKIKILVCTSSIPRIEYREIMNRYIETVINTYGNQTMFEVIISDSKEWWGDDLPINVKWVQDAPIHDELLPQVDYVITHGGCGTLQNVIKHGKPMLIIPLGDDHEKLASICNQLGISETLSAEKINKEELLYKVSRLNQCIINSRELQQKILSYNPRQKSVELIQKFLTEVK
ncbi:glycosyltransferase [Bacillus sp. SM2101]|uniref:nucleotide disphospho-sugar-binding domain-containing protein n=1 Tax=Bacillus sp. SM2101 TaxID=2805366 RepID=UPI001BDF00AD|nr:glycosyltransferase [Bacillus sp. SM2101]